MESNYTIADAFHFLEYAIEDEKIGEYHSAIKYYEKSIDAFIYAIPFESDNKIMFLLNKKLQDVRQWHLELYTWIKEGKKYDKPVKRHTKSIELKLNLSGVPKQ